MIINKDHDPVGHAFYDYYTSGKASDLLCNNQDVGDDIVPIDFYFRSYDDMPEIEKTALSIAHGRILDVGAGSGCHSIVLQEQGKDVTAIDISPLSAKTMQLRGIKKAYQQDFFSVTDNFDTVLLLMNGIGIVKDIDSFPLFFKQLDKILLPKGQLLCTSYDICNIFEDNCNKKQYYQEFHYQMRYNDIIGDPFNWFSIGAGKLKEVTEANGFSIELIEQGVDYDYLARIFR